MSIFSKHITDVSKKFEIFLDVCVFFNKEGGPTMIYYSYLRERGVGVKRKSWNSTGTGRVGHSRDEIWRGKVGTQG